jgi:hypothetical protein
MLRSNLFARMKAIKIFNSKTKRKIFGMMFAVAVRMSKLELVLIL